VAEIYPWHRQEPRAGRIEHHGPLTAIAGGLAAIVVLVALVAGIAGAALYALVVALTSLFD
jgi:Flp pilus assembly protein TadB